MSVTLIELWLKGKMRKIRNVKLIEPVNQYMTPFASKFEVVSENYQYGYNDWADSHKHLRLSVDELEVEKIFKDKSECVNVVV